MASNKGSKGRFKTRANKRLKKHGMCPAMSVETRQCVLRDLRDTRENKPYTRPVTVTREGACDAKSKEQ